MTTLHTETQPLWSPADLRLCNVKIIDTDLPALLARSDFYHPKDSHLETHPGDCSHYSYSSDPRLSNKFYGRLRRLVTPSIPDADEAEIIDSTIRLLSLLGFSQSWGTSRDGFQRPRVTKRSYDLPLFMCGSTVHTVADICIIHPSSDLPADPSDDSIVLLVKAAPSSPSTSPESPTPPWDYHDPTPRAAAIDPAAYTAAEAQLISQAIAAFQQHNRQLRRRRLPPIDRKAIPAILMAGSSSFPVLYKIEVTAHLVECVQSGQFPTRPTWVYRAVVGGRSGERVLEELGAFRALL